MTLVLRSAAQVEPRHVAALEPKA
eukprot:COSAG02_NODE_21846_length_773_cov_0.767062_1_plen_23_part_10